MHCIMNIYTVCCIMYTVHTKRYTMVVSKRIVYNIYIVYSVQFTLYAFDDTLWLANYFNDLD